MNYHIITQDKFFDQYIEDIYSLHAENNNVFWVRGNKGDNNYLKTTRHIEYLGTNKSYVVGKLQELNIDDKLFISCFDTWIGELVLFSGIQCQVYAYVMGGEFYSEPHSWHAAWLYDKMTYRQMQLHGIFPYIKWTRRNPLHWGRMFDDITRLREFRQNAKEEYRHKETLLQRLNYIVLPKQSKAEYEFIKKLYPSIQAEIAFGTFDQNYDAAILLPPKTKKNNYYNVLLGNSSDPSNNHIEGLKWIKKNIKGNCEVYCVLSYGDEIGKRLAIQEGGLLFGEHFHPITSFMARKEYLLFLIDMDIVIMNHNRQQAVGNIITSIVLGKPVILKSRNVVYQILKSEHLSSVFTFEDCESVGVDSIMQIACADLAQNRIKISNMFSEAVRLDLLKHLIK